MMVKKIIRIEGMHCNSCERIIEEAFKDKVSDIKVSYSKGEAEIEYDPEKISSDEIKEIIKASGYEIGNEKVPEDVKEEQKKKINYVPFIIMIIGLAGIIYLTYNFLSGLNLEIPVIGENSGLLLLFLVGVLTGFHCVSMCGAFVLSYTTKNALNGYKGFGQHLVYGASKVFSYAIIGGLFGLLGGFFAFSVGLRGIIAIIAGLFMIFFSLSMMGVKFFRKFQFNPKFLTKFASKASGEAKGPYKGPFITGLLGGLFIACGPLQAMYLYAAGTGNFFSGMTSLAAFGLGTLPIMFGFGSLATVISKSTTKKILKISAIIVLVLGLIMLNRGLTVMGSPVSYDIIKEKIIGVQSEQVKIVGDYQEINMDVDRYGWQPDSFVLKQGIPVKWNINVKELTGCNNEIYVKDYGLDIKLKKGMNVIEFTPDKVGTVRWSCWMGMIPGSFVITENGEATQKEIESAAPQSSGGCGCGGGNGGSCGA
jgi:sulfite exporter TauE/SafE/copper chaperone CopZ